MTPLFELLKAPIGEKLLPDQNDDCCKLRCDFETPALIIIVTCDSSVFEKLWDLWGWFFAIIWASR